MHDRPLFMFADIFSVLYFIKVYFGCGCEARISSCLLCFTVAFLAVNWGICCKRTCIYDSGFLASFVAAWLFCNEQKEQTVGRVFGRVRVPSLLGQLLPFRVRHSIRAHMLTQDRSTIPQRGDIFTQTFFICHS